MCALKGLVAGRLIRTEVKSIPNAQSNVISANVTEMNKFFSTANKINPTTVAGYFEGDFDENHPDSNLFAYEYTGYLIPDVTGNYRIGLQSDDGTDFAIYMNNQWIMLADAYGYKPPENTPKSLRTIDLIASQCYPIRIRYHEHYGGAEIYVKWWKPNARDWETLPFTAYRCNPGNNIMANNFPNPAVPVAAPAPAPAPQACEPNRCNELMRSWIMDKYWAFDNSAASFSECSGCPSRWFRAPMDTSFNGRDYVNHASRQDAFAHVKLDSRYSEPPQPQAPPPLLRPRRRRLRAGSCDPWMPTTPTTACTSKAPARRTGHR